MDYNIQTLEEYFLDKLKVKFDQQSRLSLLFTVLGEKPGANIMFVDDSKQDLLENFCEDLGLHYKSFETEIHRKYYITTNPDFFNILEKVEDGKPYHTYKSEGEFLGYPEEAVNYFVENSGDRKLGQKFENKIDEMLETGLITEDQLFLLDLRMYVPEITEEGIKNAVKVGEKRREQLRQFDRKHDSKLGGKTLEEVFSRSKPYFRIS